MIFCIGGRMNRNTNLCPILVTIIVVVSLGGCAMSDSYRASSAEQEGDYLEAAKLYESEAQRFRQEKVFFTASYALARSSYNYERSGDLVKARELAQARVEWLDSYGGGEVVTFSSGPIDTLPETADALASLADICSKNQDAACVESVGERIVGLFNPRAVPTHYFEINYESANTPFAESLDKLANAYRKVGLSELAFRAQVVQLSTGFGLDEFRYSDPIIEAKKAGKLALAAELEKRQLVLKKEQFGGGGFRRSIGESPRIVAQKYTEWADRLERAGGPALAAIARLEASAADDFADDLEANLRERLDEQNERDTRRRETEESNQQFYEGLRMLQSMQPAQ